MVFQITFTNYSSTIWTRSSSGSSTDAVLDNLTRSPSEHLQAHSGVEAIGATQDTLSFLASGLIDIYCCWRNSAGQRFGIQAWYPIHVLGIGKAPYWYVMADTIADPNLDSDPDWTLSGDDPAYVYEWNNVVGYKIKAVPTAGHSDLNINVTIQDDH